MKRLVEFSSVQPRFAGSLSWSGGGATLHSDRARKTLSWGSHRGLQWGGSWRGQHRLQWVGMEGSPLALGDATAAGKWSVRDHSEGLSGQLPHLDGADDTHPLRPLCKVPQTVAAGTVLPGSRTTQGHSECPRPGSTKVLASPQLIMQLSFFY